jgi:hypothetical protein
MQYALSRMQDTSRKLLEIYDSKFSDYCCKATLVSPPVENVGPPLEHDLIVMIRVVMIQITGWFAIRPCPGTFLGFVLTFVFVFVFVHILVLVLFFVIPVFALVFAFAFLIVSIFVAVSVPVAVLATVSVLVVSITATTGALPPLRRGSPIPQ